MFGYIITNSNLLNDEDKKYYQSCYCGLCKALEKEHKNISRMTLNYDMTFLIILLNEVYKDKVENKKLECKCVIHPLKKHTFIQNELINYVADMNVLLTYYNLLDDWNDDKNIAALSYTKLIQKEFDKISLKYPKKAEIIKNNLEKLSNIEKQNILKADLPAQCCGNFFGEIFSPYEDEYSLKLKKVGESIGKFIYILDACIDLKGDIKHKRYNPLIMNSKSEFDDMLNLLMSDVIKNYNELNISNTILENILYSGIWTKYELYKKKEEKSK
jgi:hypothetical protein